MSDAEKAKAARLAKARHDTHVNLLMIGEGLSKNDALLKAYQEGPLVGLSRMGVKQAETPVSK